MPEVLFVLEGDDPGAALLAAAFRRHGWRARLLDVRFTRPTLDACAEPAGAVRIDGNGDAPDIVINRTATSGLGLPGPAALERQLPLTWSGRHLAAREEQGLLLAVFDCWDRDSRLYNPVRAQDRRLVAALPTRVDLPPDGRRGACWIVDDTIVAACAEQDGGGWRQVAVSAATAELARGVAATSDLRLGQVDCWQQRGGSTIVTDWSPIPPFHTLRARTGIDVAALAVAALVGEPVAAAPPFLAADLESNLLAPPSARP
ncbi:hypothetical protein [Pseudonocardia sp. GCM10023141]|uniref:hypothetical protein n=1 Tax=Pseudonocardia sp. GCM10023141 TaxID=3252653 RepID=UPI00361CBCBC